MHFLSRIVERWRGPSGSSAPAASPRVYRGGPLLDYARTPDPAWQAALDAATTTGDGEQVANLHLQWHPGDPWMPVERYMIFQLQAWQFVPAHIKQELLGPHPRTNAVLEYWPRVIDGRMQMRPKLVGSPCRFVDRIQWEMHRQILRDTGKRVFPRYFWVIQGDHGGHPYQITDSEKMLRGAQGLPPDVPSAGDLPYAPFDQRVIAALTRYDLWRYAHGLGEPSTATAKVQIARSIGVEQEANRLVWASKEAMAGEIADGMAHAARADGLHYHRWRPVGEKARELDMERIKHHYITDTSLEAVS